MSFNVEKNIHTLFIIQSRVVLNVFLKSLWTKQFSNTVKLDISSLTNIPYIIQNKPELFWILYTVCESGVSLADLHQTQFLFFSVHLLQLILMY